MREDSCFDTGSLVYNETYDVEVHRSFWMTLLNPPSYALAAKKMIDTESQLTLYGEDRQLPLLLVSKMP